MFRRREQAKTSASPQRLLRLFAFVLAILSLLAGQVQVGRHEVSHIHVVCAVHGGTVEDLPRTREASKASTAATLFALLPSHKTHQPCVLPPALTSGALFVPPPAFAPRAPLPVAALEEVPFEGPVERSGPSIYDLAPKLSPPNV